MRAESDSTPDRQGLKIHPLFVKHDEVHLRIELPGGRRWPLRIHSIRFSPPLPNDFLLPQFPLTLALTEKRPPQAPGFSHGDKAAGFE